MLFRLIDAENIQCNAQLCSVAAAICVLSATFERNKVSMNMLHEQIHMLFSLDFRYDQYVEIQNSHSSMKSNFKA
jgi:hypothetical protein